MAFQLKEYFDGQLVKPSWCLLVNTMYLQVKGTKTINTVRLTDPWSTKKYLPLYFGTQGYGMKYLKKFKATKMCLSIMIPKNNKFSICSKWKIYYI